MTTQTLQSDTKMIPKLRFSGFSDEWEEKSIGELGKIITGNTPSTLNRTFYSDDFMFVSPVDIENNRFVNNTKTKVSKSGFENGRKINEGSVLFVCIGSTIGKIAQSGAECITNQQINSIEANKYNSNDFIFFKLKYISKRIKLLAGSQAVPMINKTDFSMIRTSFPSLLEQQKIASFLGSIDKLIENLRNQKENLEFYKKGMMYKIFTQEIRFKDKNGEEFSKWEENKLGELDIFVSDGNYGEMYPKASEMINKGIPFIRANNISSLKIIWSDMKYISKELHEILKSGHLKTGDILLTTRGDIGTLAYVDEEFNNANINAQICLLRCGENISSRFILNYLASKYGQKQFKELQTGSALKQLPKGNLAKLKINLPSFEEQKKIGEFLTYLDKVILLKNNQIVQAEQWKKGLMQGLFI